jgi:tetratricopeptide (TPR) repeat protein
MGRGTTITEWGNKLDAAARQLARRQPTFSVDPMFDKFREAGTIVPGGEPSFANWQDRFADFTSGDLERYLTERRPQGNSLRYLTDALRRASPHSPTCIASRIEYFWDESRPQVDTWKREHGDHPVVAAALAVKYSKLKDWAEAEKFLRLYIDKAPDQWAYQMLADNYLAQGDEANWLATLKARLEKPDYSLDHAWTNNTIARHYMGQRKWTTARPYAEAAAQSYARWALETVAECYDGLGERERASAVRAAIAERYGR